MSDFLDQIKRNNQPDPKKPSAADPAQIMRNLPSGEEEFKRAEKLTDLFDTTKRAGAKSKPGLFGIRPSGGKAASDFLENYTGTGRTKPKKEAFSEALPSNIAKKTAPQHSFRPPAVVMPPTFCPDCGRTDRPSQLGAMNVCILGSQQAEACRSVGIDPMDIILNIFCQECMKKAYAAGKVDSRAEVSQPVVMPNGTIEYETPSQGYLRKRLLRITDNMIDYMRIERVKGDSPIFRKSNGGSGEFIGAA